MKSFLWLGVRLKEVSFISLTYATQLKKEDSRTRWIGIYLTMQN